MKKEYRPSICINGKEYKGPRFSRKFDSDQWKSEMLKKKKFMKDGLTPPINSSITLDKYFEETWIVKRKERYLKPTWGPDEQRYRDYIKDKLGSYKVSKINQLQVRLVLQSVTSEDKRAVATRNRVRSLLSKIFNDAMNEEIPLRSDNPALRISFDDPRSGRKDPIHLKKESDILHFIKCAKEISFNHYVYACITLMSGLRKQELIPLKWSDLNTETGELLVDEKFIQAEGKIISGTKSGTSEVRTVPIPDELVLLLVKFREKAEFQNDDDFILAKPSGDHYGSRDIGRLHDSIRKLSNLNITPHGLRHTYGRQFVLKGGNKSVLQTILGHSNSQTTELYSRLAGSLINKHRNVVSYSLDKKHD